MSGITMLLPCASVLQSLSRDKGGICEFMSALHRGEAAAVTMGVLV